VRMADAAQASLPSRARELTCQGSARNPPSGKRRGLVFFVGAGSSDPLNTKDGGRPDTPASPAERASGRRRRERRPRVRKPSPRESGVSYIKSQRCQSGDWRSQARQSPRAGTAAEVNRREVLRLRFARAYTARETRRETSLKMTA
jgi:hypothetical protein